MSAYADLLIRIFPWDPAKNFYPVEAELGGGARFENGQLRLERAALLEQENSPATYGQLLFNALFSGEILQAYQRAKGSADGRVRMRLWVDNAAVELHALSWERLYHPGPDGRLIPLTTSDATPFSRYTSLQTNEPAPIAKRPLKLLAAIANPSNLPAGLAAVDMAREIKNLLSALKGVEVQVTLLPGYSGLPAELKTEVEQAGWQVIAGQTDLDQIMKHLPGMHILHFIGHGQFKRDGDRGAGQAWLIVEEDDGAPARISDSEISAKIGGMSQPPHLAYFVACESAKREEQAEHPFIGLGPKLVQAGVPAVVAMQKQVPIDLARELSGTFYHRLLEHGAVDQALSQARNIVFDEHSTDWAIPVLFSRIVSGELFSDKPKEEKAMPDQNITQTGDGNVAVQGTGNTINVTSNKTVTNQSGGVNFNNVGSVSVGGDIVGGDKITTGGDGGLTAERMKAFMGIQRQIKELPLSDGDKEDLKDTVKKIEKEAKKDDAANVGSLERWIKYVAGMSNDIAQVVANTLIDPALGFATVIRKVAEKAKEAS